MSTNLEGRLKNNCCRRSKEVLLSLVKVDLFVVSILKEPLIICATVWSNYQFQSKIITNRKIILDQNIFKPQAAFVVGGLSSNSRNPSPGIDIDNLTTLIHSLPPNGCRKPFKSPYSLLYCNLPLFKR